MGTSKKAPPGAPFSASTEAPSQGTGFDLDAFLEQDRSLSGVSPGETGLPAPLATVEPPSDNNWGMVVSQSGVGASLISSIAEAPSISQAPADWGSLAAEPAAESAEESLATETHFAAPLDAKVEKSAAIELEGGLELPLEMSPLEEAPSAAGGGTQVLTLDALETSLPEVGGEEEVLAAAPAPAPAYSPPPSGVTGAADSETLRKYALLKEREAFEREATNRALQGQIEQIRAKLSRSETERRRLTVALQEAETLRRSLEDAKEQAKHHVHKVESHHQEELRALQLRLDNAQFQAAKAEKKLEDFRERVRSDIQKIRLRERELANRLELQKRDAEALLTVKDEKLLQQKRDIDRLEYEFEILKERLVEDTEKAEERMGRLSRALKAMKLAEGLLSEIDEEVLPGFGSQSKKKTGEAA